MVAFEETLRAEDGAQWYSDCLAHARPQMDPSTGTSQPTSQLANQPANQLANQPANQPAIQLTNQEHTTMNYEIH